MPTSSTSGPGRAGNDRPEVVRGAYVPVGKVDIAAIRAASKTKEERPEPVKGAYQPIGKVDIAAIRAQSKPKGAVGEEKPKSLTERSVAFTASPPNQAERLTSLPKPKPAKKFGAGAPSFGTKPITPGGVGHIPTSAPVGTANKDFASQGGKSPAQIWAEKKARERGESIPSALSPSSTGSRPKTADVEEPVFSGVSAMKSKFGSVPPMGAQYSGYSGRSASPPLPSPPQDSRPSLAGSGAIAMPGFPPRPQHTEEDASAPPPPPPQPPRSPTPPTPPAPSSPVRIAMPVGRGREEEEPVRKVEEEPQYSLPVESLSRVVPHEEDLPEEEPARERGHVAAELHSAGQTAKVEYDYEKADTNEIDLVEGEIITNVDMVDEVSTCTCLHIIGPANVHRIGGLEQTPEGRLVYSHRIMSSWLRLSTRNLLLHQWPADQFQCRSRSRSQLPPLPLPPLPLLPRGQALWHSMIMKPLKGMRFLSQMVQLLRIL